MTGFLLFAALMAICLIGVFETQYRGRNGLALALFAGGLVFALAAGEAADKAAIEARP